MILAILVFAIMVAAQNITVGYKQVYEYADGAVQEPRIKDFASIDDAMEYAELRKTGWTGDVHDFYIWKEEE